MKDATPRLFCYSENVPIWDWSTVYSDWPCQDEYFFMVLPNLLEECND